MTTKILTLIMLMLAATALDAAAASQVVNLTSTGVESRTVVDRGKLHIFHIAIPEGVAGKRLDTVLIEFEVNTELEESESPDMSPVIAVYPLLEAASPNESPEVATSFPTLANVKPGDGQRVLVDITDVVRGWIAEPLTNHGLVVGTFVGPKLTKLDVSSDFVSTGEFARVTFFYQNRFGDRLSTRQKQE